jgi:hypothetical protein
MLDQLYNLISSSINKNTIINGNINI